MVKKNGSSICLHARHYHIWIYTFNVVIMALSIIFVLVANYVLEDEKLIYFFSLDISHADFALWYIYMGPALQFLICFMGILATIASRPRVLQMFWYFTALLIISDVAIGLAWVPRFKMYHQHLPTHLRQLVENAKDERFCLVWNKMQEELKCCGINSYKDWYQFKSFCQEPFFEERRLPHSCCVYQQKFCNSSLLGDKSIKGKDDSGCVAPLLKWFHSRADILFMLGYCTLFVLKIITLIILKREIRELLQEIYHERENPQHHRRISDFIGVSYVYEDDDDVIDIRTGRIGRKRPSVIDIIGKRIGVQI